MNLNVENWKPFKIGNLFSLFQNGKANQGLLQDGLDCFYVGAKKDDNGVMFTCKRDEELVQKGNCIIFICNGEGSVGFSNYMDVDFIGTTDIVAAYNSILNENIGTFLATVFSKERPKYSFGRKWKKYLKETEVLLPTKYNSDGTLLMDRNLEYSKYGYIPDWDFMDNYIKSLSYKPLTTKNNSRKIKDLNIQFWKEFRVGKLFKCETTKMLIKDELEDGSIPFISRSAENNGCIGYVDADPEYINKQCCLTIGAEGVYSFYQDMDFVAGNKVYTLKNENLNVFNAIFISTILNRDAYKFSYGRARILSKLKQEIIKLPIIMDKDNLPFIDIKRRYSDDGFLPDWKFMENYVKSLPYGDRL